MTHQPDLNGAAPKGKRSWGDRLKLGLARGTPPEGPGPGGGGIPRGGVPPGVPPGVPNGVPPPYLMHEYRYGSVSGGSALSKSMKYAETWLYGTVSARPVATRASAFGLHRHDAGHAGHAGPPLIVMCSCPEFLAGTTRNKKTASACKKCGGSRRPVPTTVGTVRGYGTVSQPARIRPSLMELTGNPMLGHAPDPYDLMRRSRMAVDGGLPSPTAAPPASAQKTHHHKARAKSSSPPRRRRIMSPSQPAAPRTDPRTAMTASRDIGEWAMAEDDLTAGFADKRKSILECEVNPYDLISKYLKNGPTSRSRENVRGLCSDGGESSDNLSDNALEDLPRNGSRGRPEMTTFGKVPQHVQQQQQQQQQLQQQQQQKVASKNVTSPFARKPLFQKEDLNKLGAKFSHLKQSLSPDSKKSTVIKKTDSAFKINGVGSEAKEAGVTISGQRIRIFNGTANANGTATQDGEFVNDDVLDENPIGAKDEDDDDDPVDDVTTTSEEEPSSAATCIAPSASPRIPRLASPKRPPRKSKQTAQSSQEAPERSLDAKSSPSALQLRRQRSQSLVSPVPEVGTTIKSILKKSQGADLLSGGSGVDSGSSTSSPPSSAGGSISSGTSQFYLPTFKEFKEQQKKKKQVQFRVSEEARVGAEEVTVNAEEVVVVVSKPPIVPSATTTAIPERTPSPSPSTMSSPGEGSEQVPGAAPLSPLPSCSDDSDVPTSPEPVVTDIAIVARVSSPEGATSTDDEVAKETGTDSGDSAGPGRPRASTLRRSLSERLAAPPRRPPKDGVLASRASKGGKGGAQDMFNDTMRLRLRTARPSSRAVFSDDSSGTEDAPRRAHQRPREPPPPPPPPLGERPTPIGRTNSNAKAYEEHAKKTLPALPKQVHRLEIKNVLSDDEPTSLDMDVLAQRTTSIFIDCPSPEVAVKLPEGSPTPARRVGNKVTISVGGSVVGDIDYQDVPFGAQPCSPPDVPSSAKPSVVGVPASVQPVVIPVAHQNHCSRVEIGDQSDEKRTSTKMTVRIGPATEAADVVVTSPTARARIAPDSSVDRTFDSSLDSSLRKPAEPNETFNLLIAESVDPVEAVRRNLVPHVCGGADVRDAAADTPSTPTTPPLPPGTDSGGSSRSNSLDESDAEDRLERGRESSASSVTSAGRGKSGADIMREVLSLGRPVPQGTPRGTPPLPKEESRSKFYVWVDSTVDEGSVNHYEMIRDPIYEEIINDEPPPLPLSPPPIEDKMSCCRSIFEGASKDDILSYLVDARERGIVPSEELYFGSTGEADAGEDSEDSQPQHSRQTSLDLGELSSRVSQLSNTSDSSEDSVNLMTGDSSDAHEDSKVRRAAADIERNDSGVGSETSRTSRARWQQLPADQRDQRHGCEDCEMPVETHVTDSGLMFAPLVCRKCAKRRLERREIIQEIVDTEEKFAGDLRILLDEFYKPMLVAGLLAREQLSAIFLNAEELLAHATALAERLRDTLEIAMEQGDDDLLSVDIGRLFLAATPMLRAFEHYCTRQAAASLLLASLEKEKELLRIFLRVSQMENAVLRRMNLNSFLMVPVQRVTKYPLLLARLYKVTPCSHPAKELLLQAQHHIELHLEHMNSVAKDISSTKLWRRITITNGRRAGAETDMVNIKLRKMAVEVLEWTQDVSFPMEGRLLFAQPADSSWRRGRAVKMSPVSALLVTHGHPAADTPVDAPLHFPAHSGVRAATLLLLKEKCGRYSLLRDPLFLDKCMVCCEVEWDDYFEVQELSTKDSFIFKAEDAERTRTWYRQLQLHAQGLGSWRKRRNALANIMINGMQLRS